MGKESKNNGEQGSETLDNKTATTSTGKVISDADGFGALESLDKRDMTALTSDFLKLDKGQEINVKVIGEEQFEGDFGVQTAIIVEDKEGSRFRAADKVLVGAFQEYIEKKCKTYPFFAKVVGGPDKMSKKDKPYQTFEVFAL